MTKWGNPGITSLEMSFDGVDVTGVNQIALQAADVTSITFTRIYLVVAEQQETFVKGEDLFLNAPQNIWNAEFSPYGISITFNSTWGEYPVINADNPVSTSDYVGFRVEYEPKPETAYDDNGWLRYVQVKLGPGDGVQYVPLNPNSNVTEGYFNDDIIALGDLEVINIQGAYENTSIVIKAFYLIKADGTKEQIAFRGATSGYSGWGHTLDQYYPSGILTFTGQYGGVSIVDDAFEEVTYEPANGVQAYKYVVELNKPAPNGIMFELQDETSGFAWFGEDAGKTKYEVDISDDTCSKNMSRLFIKANQDEGYPFDIEIKRVYRVPIGTIIPKFLLGDANGDGEVTVTDVSTAVDYILSNSTGFIVMRNADVNCDGEVNISDVTLIVDIILNNTQMYTVTVSNTQYQTITGFGAASCDGAMCPLGTDTQPVKLLYGAESKIGLNIMRMEISPNFEGDVRVPEWNNWDTPYDWQGSVPSALIVKQRGGIVFGTPWSPPGEYKTNGTAQGGNSEDQGYQRGQLREDCYDKFFPWLNTFLEYMKSKGVEVDAVSIQNEPDWWVDYSGCLYTPQQQLNLVKNYAHMLDRNTYGGVRLISAEPLGFDPNYSNTLLRDQVARDQIDIIAGHLYGHPPLGNMKSAATLASSYGKEVWMTEHTVTDNAERLPNWHEQLLFAEELNECMLAGCTAYIYWYMRAHWSFVGTGEEKYNPGNTKNVLLPRAYVMSHFSKYVTGSTRLGTTASVSTGTNSAFETSAYIKGDSLIVMVIDTTKNASNLKLNLPVKVKSGVRLSSTSNVSLCQETPIGIDKPTQELIVKLPERSLNTFIFIIDNKESIIQKPQKENKKTSKTVAPPPLE